MNILFQQAKNGEETALINGVFLHSNYNPSKEAERFASTFQTTFNPHYLVLIEPGLPYTLPYFRKRFPECKIGVIRYIQDFTKFNSDYDFTIDITNNIDSLDDKLFRILDEEKLLLTAFASWPPISKSFPEQDMKLWQKIKQALEKAKTILITREYFEKKWLINSINFLKYSNNYISLNTKINKPVIIISSGPSLKPVIPVIFQNRKKFFIICLSSAISVCLKNNIIPDLCVSTDGGYWAGQHLKKLNNNNIPLALPAEAFCPKTLLKSLKVLPLDYGDGLSNKLIEVSGITALPARRNGTVSGTALEFALSITDESIFFCGLDLSCQKGFQHSQPNELEINNSIFDNHISSKEKRCKRSEFSSESLNYYLQWFKQYNPGNKKVFRIMDSEFKNNSLDYITDIKTPDFIEFAKKFTNVSQTDYFKNIDNTVDLIKVINYVQTELSTEKILKQLYPLKNILLIHENDNLEIKNKIMENHSKVLKQINGILNG